MFINKEIKCSEFEPDSSPAAWEHYKQFYVESNFIRKNYNFENLNCYTYYKDLDRKCGYKTNEGWYNYVNIPKNNTDTNRLYALYKFAKHKTDENQNEWCCATRRVAGECDFNFNEKKCKLFKDLIGNNNQALKRLDRCKKMHHTLLNFSLMESMGNMQAFKGSNRLDRFDYFIYKLDQYFGGISGDIMSKSTIDNRGGLIEYLSEFGNIYKYCSEVYFLKDNKFVDEIIASGARSIRECDDVVRYMNLAEKFWATKEYAFLEKEFLIVGDCFNEGGETYTYDELSRKIEDDLGLGLSDARFLIKKCVERGFIIDCGNERYTR